MHRLTWKRAHLMELKWNHLSLHLHLGAQGAVKIPWTKWEMLSILLRMLIAAVFSLHLVKTISRTRFPPEMVTGKWLLAFASQGSAQITWGWILAQSKCFKLHIYSSVCLRKPPVIWYPSLSSETVFIRRVKCISLLHQAPQLIFITSVFRFI